MTGLRLIPLSDSCAGPGRRINPLCLVIAPLALVWASGALAAETGTGTSAASSGSSDTGTATSAQSSDGSAYEDSRPIVISNSDAGDYQASGPGTSNPLGFGGGLAGGFAPAGCAPDTAEAEVASEIGSTLDTPASPARSAGRYIRASVAGSETYTDNLNLDSHHTESDYVTAVAPRVDACSSTGRIRGQASYQLEGVVYANHSHDNDVYNDFVGSTTAELIANHLYLDANTEYGKQVIDPAVGYSRSNIIRPNDNKTTAWDTNISPYFLQSLGALGQGMLRYRYGRSIYKDDGVPDTTVHGVVASLTSPDSVDPVSWQAQAVTQSVERSSGDEQRFIDQFREIFGNDALPDNYQDPNRTQHFDSATLQLGYRVSRTLTLTTLGGVEDRYRDNGDNDRWSAPRWQVGARWASASNSLELDYGHRFYGASYTLTAAHHGRLVDMSLSYDEDPSSPGLDSLDDTGSDYTFGSVGSIGGLLGNGVGDYDGTNSLLDRGVYVRKRWQARIGINTALTRTEITGYSQRQDYQSAGVADTRDHGVELDTRYDLGPRTRIVPSASWQHYDSGFDNGHDSDNYNAGVSLVRAVSRSAEAAVGYSRNWRNDDDGFGYHENEVTLQFRKAF